MQAIVLWGAEHMAVLYSHDQPPADVLTCPPPYSVTKKHVKMKWCKKKGAKETHRRAHTYIVQLLKAGAGDSLYGFHFNIF